MTSTLGVQEVSTTAGTGAYALGGPTPNSWAFRDKVPSGTFLTYEATDGARSEYGLGRFEFPATLHRQSIINSSEADAAVDWPVSGQCIISLVQEPGAALPPGGDCAQALIKYSSVDYAASWQWRPYPIAAWIDGAPGANRQIRLAITEWVRFAFNFNGSIAYADTAPALDVAVAINRITSAGASIPIGVVTFFAGASVGYWTSTGGVEQHLMAGDRIEFLFPSSSAGMLDIAMTARGIIICGG